MVANAIKASGMTVRVATDAEKVATAVAYWWLKLYSGASNTRKMVNRLREANPDLGMVPHFGCNRVVDRIGVTPLLFLRRIDSPRICGNCSQNLGNSFSRVCGQ